MNPAVYILTNKHHTTLYIGVTSNLEQRISQHKSKLIGGFTSNYRLDILVHYECYATMADAISREKMIKKKSRKGKNALIGKANPDWVELQPEHVHVVRGSPTAFASLPPGDDENAQASAPG